MTRESIIKLARKAGLANARDETDLAAFVLRFAALVAAAEREACARVAEEPVEFTSPEASRIAAAIRARSQA